ncbi:histidine phosphatase family protein [Salicola sp. Rm-C-2C1-2]|uniref:histidine phosphatase family protein n=1 Tax=Salicola sp. Rm-C-2C1-2 TaxID=3141321 RepID=UPI0032E37FFE
MATLHLIRHGQASFGASDYDQLSERGWEQGRVLGRWVSRHTQPERLFGGELRRHRETIDALAEGFGGGFPESRVHPGLNEFDHRAVLAAYRPGWGDPETMARELAKQPDPRKAFQDAFSEAIRRWIGGEHELDYPESWRSFKKRVLVGFEEVIRDAGDARHVFVVTSGGPISVMAQSLLELDDTRAFQLNEVLANASVSRVLFSGERRSLAVFNSFGHLEGEDPKLVTYR